MCTAGFRGPGDASPPTNKGGEGIYGCNQDKQKNRPLYDDNQDRRHGRVNRGPGQTMNQGGRDNRRAFGLPASLSFWESIGIAIIAIGILVTFIGASWLLYAVYPGGR